MHVWAKGDKCLAPYSEDGEEEEFHEARIEKIMKLHGSSQMVAVVVFVGYEDDGQEAFDISKLRKVEEKSEKRKSPESEACEEPVSQSSRVHLFSQEEEKKRICLLYDDPDDEEAAESSRVQQMFDDPAPSTSTQQKRATRPKPSKKPADKSKSGTSSKDDKKSESQATDSPAGSDFSGFTEDDMERPKFRHVTGGDKVPLVLSAPDVNPPVQVPATINQYLRDYQRDGIKFLYENYSRGKGAILADDMGLGKTVQVIGFIAAILGRTGTKTDVMKQVPKFIRRLSDPNVSMEEEKDRKTFLIIGPASVLYNWVDEFETWGYFTVGKFHQNHKEEAVADLKKNKLDVVVTTYETCRDNLDIINEFKWAAVIADEAHKIKGIKSEISIALKRLRCKKRYGLSGTVLQNDMKELWCVLDWANPKCLDSLNSFEANFIRTINQGQKRDASKRELAMARKAKQEFGKLRAQWMIRRTKALIADQLPTKDQKVVYCQPTSFQVSVYKAILGHKLMKAVLTQNHPCPCDSGRSRGKCCTRTVVDSEGREYPIKSVTMTFMHLLMKVSNHVALLLPSHTDSEEQQIRAREICDVAFSEHPQFLQQTRTASFRTLSDPKYCGKMKVLCGLLSVFKKERSKVLIFSLSTRLLDILEQYIISKGYEYRRLDGKTPNIRRTQLVREFNKERSIFLFIASTKAGGIGLNLTGANVVVIFDPNWNPSHDLQAEDRAYRIGQGRDVRVFRLISSGTIEEMVYLRQIYKQQLDKVVVADENARRLFHGVQGDSSNTGELFGMTNLFKLREGEHTLTADILKRNEQTEAGLKGFEVIGYVAPKNDSEKSEEEVEDKEEPKEVKDEGETADDMYGTDNLLIGLFDSDDEKDRKPSPKKKKRDILDSISEDESPPDEPSKSTARKARKRPIQLRKSSESDDDSGESLPLPSKSKTPKTRGRKLPRSMSLSKGSESDDKDSQKTRRKSKDFELPKSLGSKKKRLLSKRRGSDSEDSDTPRRESTSVQPPLTVPQSYDSLSDVFENCGVVHTHDNRRIVGRSSAEDYMTRCAIQEVYELHQNSQEPAIQCEPLSSSEESDDFGSSSIIQPVASKSKEKTDSIQSAVKNGSAKRPAQAETSKVQKSKSKPGKNNPKKTPQKKRPVDWDKRSPTKRVTVAKGCEFNTPSSDEEMHLSETEETSKRTPDKNSQVASRSKQRDSESAIVVESTCISGSELSNIDPSADDDKCLSNTQSIIDNLLGICDSDTLKKDTKKSKRIPQKTIAKKKESTPKKKPQESPGSDKEDNRDTMALIDALFD